MLSLRLIVGPGLVQGGP